MKFVNLSRAARPCKRSDSKSDETSLARNTASLAFPPMIMWMAWVRRWFWWFYSLSICRIGVANFSRHPFHFHSWGCSAESSSHLRLMYCEIASYCFKAVRERIDSRYGAVYPIARTFTLSEVILCYWYHKYIVIIDPWLQCCHCLMLFLQRSDLNNSRIMRYLLSWKDRVCNLEGNLYVFFLRLIVRFQSTLVLLIIKL